MWPRKFITQNIQDGHVYEQGGGVAEVHTVAYRIEPCSMYMLH